MVAEPTPAQTGRNRALSRLADAADALLHVNPPIPTLTGPDAEYLTAYRETCTSVAARLRASAETGARAGLLA